MCVLKAKHDDFTTSDTHRLRQQVALLTGVPLKDTPIESAQLKWCIKAYGGKRVVKENDYSHAVEKSLEMSVEAALDADGKVIGHMVNMRRVLESATFCPGEAMPSVEDITKAQQRNFEALTGTIAQLSQATQEERVIFTKALNKISSSGRVGLKQIGEVWS